MTRARVTMIEVSSYPGKDLAVHYTVWDRKVIVLSVTYDNGPVALTDEEVDTARRAAVSDYATLQQAVRGRNPNGQA